MTPRIEGTGERSEAPGRRPSVLIVLAIAAVAMHPLQVVAQASSPDANEEQSSADPRDDDRGETSRPWELYHEAFLHLAEDDTARAVQRLEQLRQEFPGHPAAEAAGPILTALEARRERKRASTADSRDDDAREKTRTDRFGIEEPTGLARAELVTFQTLHGIVLGAEACVIISCREARATVTSLAAGGGSALGLSLFLSRDGVTTGQALAINSGTVFGLWEAIALNSMTGNWQSGPANSFLPLVFGQIAGLGVGAGAWQAFRPNSGDVALVNAGGLWSGAFTALAFPTLGVEPSRSARYGTLLATTNAGAVGAAVLASQRPMSRGRVHLIDLGGVLGGLVGFGGVVLARGDLGEARVASGATMLGAGLGLGIAGYATRNWSPQDSASRSASRPLVPSVAVDPVRTGQGGSLSISGRF